MTDKDDTKPPAGSLATEQQDLKELKSKFGSQLSTLKELFPEWSDDDLLFAIRDAEGDLELAVDRISEGMMPSSPSEPMALMLNPLLFRARFPVGRSKE